MKVADILRPLGGMSHTAVLMLFGILENTMGEISSDLYHALQCDIEISKVKSFELEKK